MSKRNTDNVPYISARCEFIWEISLESGFNLNIIYPTSSSVIIHPLDFVLDLLPSDAIIRFLFCWMKLMSGSVFEGSL